MNWYSAAVYCTNHTASPSVCLSVNKELFPERTFEPHFLISQCCSDLSIWRTWELRRHYVSSAILFYWNNPCIENTIRDLYWRQGENHETWKKEHADWRNPQEFIYLWQKTTTVLSVRLQSQFNWKGTTKYNETRVTFETTEHILKFKNGEWNGFWLISLYQEESGSRHNGAPMSKHYDEFKLCPHK